MYRIHYLKGGPQLHIGILYLTPLVTLVALCHTKEGKQIIVPLLAEAVMMVRFFTPGFC
tara:strand:+ start:440 stop:616 length:177 start_codon:yes stop_codon:yes gene_type:complete